LSFNVYAYSYLFDKIVITFNKEQQSDDVHDFDVVVIAVKSKSHNFSVSRQLEDSESFWNNILGKDY